jgi:hypothetical protein
MGCGLTVVKVESFGMKVHYSEVFLVVYTSGFIEILNCQLLFFMLERTMRLID